MNASVNVPRRMEWPFRVRFDECGANGRLRDSGLLRFAQEMAWIHSEVAGIDRPWYLERGMAWVVRGASIEVRTPIEYGEAIAISTEVGGWRRVWARRHSEYRNGAAMVAAVADIDWVLLGPNGAPIRIPPEIESVFTTLQIESAPAITPTRAAVDVGTPATTLAVDIRRRDLDPMAHVNNAIYLDDAEEAIVTAGGEAAVMTFPRYWTMEFVRPAGPEDRLIGEARPTDDGWSYRLVDGDDAELFRARLKIES